MLTSAETRLLNRAEVECGRAIRMLSLMDDYKPDWLALEVDTSFASGMVQQHEYCRADIH